MKTLFERLKPEFREQLESQLERYPSSIGKIIDELKENYFYVDIKYGTVLETGLFISGTFEDMFEDAKYK